MRNLTFIFLVLLVVSCKKENGQICTLAACEYVGTYNGRDVEMRSFDETLTSMNPDVSHNYKTSFEIIQKSEFNNNVTVFLGLCKEENEDPIYFTLQGIADDRGIELTDESFLDSPADGLTTTIKNGVMLFDDSNATFTFTFTERREFENFIPTDDGEQYTSSHIISTNRVNTGSHNCN